MTPVLAVLALLAAAPAPAATASPVATPVHRKVAFLVHSPGIAHASDLSAAVANGLAQSGYTVFQRGLLLQKLGVAPGVTPADPTAALRAKLDAADQHYFDLDLAAADVALREVEAGLSPLLGDPEAI